MHNFDAGSIISIGNMMSAASAYLRKALVKSSFES